jgi:hypothetical protein
MCWQTLVPAYDGSHTATIVMIGKCLRGPFTRLSDEPGPVVQVACTKCEWKAAISRPGQGYEPDWLVDEPPLCEHLPVDAQEKVKRAGFGDR